VVNPIVLKMKKTPNRKTTRDLGRIDLQYDLAAFIGCALERNPTISNAMFSR
jgi:hypothetical protein